MGQTAEPPTVVRNGIISRLIFYLCVWTFRVVRECKMEKKDTKNIDRNLKKVYSLFCLTEFQILFEQFPNFTRSISVI